MEDDREKSYIIDLDESWVEISSVFIGASLKLYIDDPRGYFKDKEIKIEFKDEEIAYVVRDVMVKSIEKGENLTDNEITDASLKRLKTWAKRRYNSAKKKQLKS